MEEPAVALLRDHRRVQMVDGDDRVVKQRRLELTARVGGLAVFTCLSLPLNIRAEQLSGDIAGDSEIELVENVGYGSVRGHRITISTQDGSTTVKVVRDGVEHQGTMTLEACLDLWKFLLDLGIEQMKDARPELMPVDASGFSLKFRVDSTRHEFTSYAVNSLPDTRYQKAIEKILQAAEASLPE